MAEKRVDPSLALLEAVEALCGAWVGRAAEGEQWIETCRRLEALDKLAKRARKARTARETQAA